MDLHHRRPPRSTPAADWHKSLRSSVQPGQHPGLAGGYREGRELLLGKKTSETCAAHTRTRRRPHRFLVSLLPRTRESASVLRELRLGLHDSSPCAGVGGSRRARATLHPRCSRAPGSSLTSEVRALIGDGKADRAFQIVYEAMRTQPDEGLFVLWSDCINTLPDSTASLSAARELYRQRSGDVWSTCCLIDVLTLLGRNQEADQLLQRFLTPENENFFPCSTLASVSCPTMPTTLVAGSARSAAGCPARPRDPPGVQSYR